MSGGSGRSITDVSAGMRFCFPVGRICVSIKPRLGKQSECLASLYIPLISVVLLRADYSEFLKSGRAENKRAVDMASERAGKGQAAAVELEHATSLKGKGSFAARTRGRVERPRTQVRGSLSGALRRAAQFNWWYLAAFCASRDQSVLSVFVQLELHSRVLSVWHHAHDSTGEWHTTPSSSLNSSGKATGNRLSECRHQS